MEVMSKLIKKYQNGQVIYNPYNVELHLQKDMPTTSVMQANIEKSLKRLKQLASPEESMDATVRYFPNGISTYKPTAQQLLRDMHGKKELSFSDYLGLAPVVLPATSRGGTDPALDVIFDKNSKLVNNLIGTSPKMLDPVEARTAGMELDRAWEAAQPYINEFYKGVPQSIQKERFFYDYLRASDDAGQKFYEYMQKNAPEWTNRYSVDHDFISNNFANGIEPDEAAFEFWNRFVQNNYTPKININESYIT